MAAAEDITDLGQGGVGHFAGEVHRDLPGVVNPRQPLLALGAQRYRG